MSRFGEARRKTIETALLDVAERVHSGTETVTDLQVVSALGRTEVPDSRAVQPLPMTRAPYFPARAQQIEPGLRAFLEFSLGVPIFGMEVELLKLMLGPSRLVWSSLAWTSLFAALPFEALWVAVTVLRHRRGD